MIFFLIKHRFHYLPESVAVVFLGTVCSVVKFCLTFVESHSLIQVVKSRVFSTPRKYMLAQLKQLLFYTYGYSLFTLTSLITQSFLYSRCSGGFSDKIFDSFQCWKLRVSKSLANLYQFKIISVYQIIVFSFSAATRRARSYNILSNSSSTNYF